MPTMRKCVLGIVAGLVVLGLCGEKAGAQAYRQDILRVREFDGMDRRALLRSPEYQTNMSGGMRKSKEWLRLRVSYETAPEWIDELIFQYYLLTMVEEDGQRRYSLFRKKVRYVDIERDRKHYSEVFLHPNTLKRHGEPVAMAVEITYQNGTVALEHQETGKTKLPESWWKSPDVTESKTVSIRDADLLSRDQTPFAFINFDDYEVIR